MPVLLAAAAAASIGGAIGYWIGRAAGYPLALRYGPIHRAPPRAGLSSASMFLKHGGGKIVFFSRFIAILQGGGGVAGRRPTAWNGAGSCCST